MSVRDRSGFAAPRFRVVSFVIGVVLGAGACNEKKTSETAASADANAKAEAGLVTVLDASDIPVAADAGDVTDATTTTTSGDAGTRGEADAATEAGSRGARVVVDESGEGKTVDLAPGQSLVILLTANPTSGFDWAVIKAPPALGTPEMGFVPGGSQMGAPGKRRLTFTLKSALPAGEHGIELGYARSFEKGVAPFKTFRIKVRAAH